MRHTERGTGLASVTSDPPLLPAEEFAAAAREFTRAEGVEAVLNRVCQIAVGQVPQCEHAAILLVAKHRRIEIHGATDAVAELAGRLQQQTGEGPSNTALAENHDVIVADFTREHMWPRFTAQLLALTGVRTMACFRLFDAEKTFGALNLYGTSRNAFSNSADFLRWGRVYTAHASLALAGTLRQEDLRAAIESRETISVAIGVLMTRQGVSRAEAFDILRRASQRMNVQLKDLATNIAGSEKSVTPRDVEELLRSLELD